MKMRKDVEELQGDAGGIRNVCLVAHVDHGKTTIADCLVSTNGIISRVSAGKLRYLDFMEYEQRCGITIKSSCITLVYREEEEEEGGREYLVNLVDSPGHMDFSAEVSSALRMVDGCVVVVDVVEGVCIQTRAVLRQAWSEGVKPCLVLNKIDKLFLNLGMDLEEVKNRIVQVIEQVNEVIGSLWVEELTKRSFFEDSNLDHSVHSASLENCNEDEKRFFSPEHGNVIFASAVDGWGFRVEDFARIYRKKLGSDAQDLVDHLWGDYYYLPKSRKVVKEHGLSSVHVFTKFVLSPIYDVYVAIFGKNERGKLPLNVNRTDGVANLDRICKMARALGFDIPTRYTRMGDPRNLLNFFMSQWLPLSNAILSTVVKCLPSPRIAQEKRLGNLLHTSYLKNEKLKNCICKCEAGCEVPVIAYVSKVFAVNANQMPRTLGIDSGQTAFVAMTRLFGGQIKSGDTLRIMNARYDPSNPDKNVSELVVPNLFILMGPYLRPVVRVTSGMVFGIGVNAPPLPINHFVSHIVKTATITSEPDFPSFNSIPYPVNPILRVAVEPENAGDLSAFSRGMNLLHQSDPAVDVRLLDSGEHIIGVLGELHLNHCLEVLREFAKISLKVSQPIISFRETIGNRSIRRIKDDSTSKDVIVEHSPDRSIFLALRAVPLPEPLAHWLEENKNDTKKIAKSAPDHLASHRTDWTSRLTKALPDSIRTYWMQQIPYIWSFGPNWCGPNLLLNHIPKFAQEPHWKRMFPPENPSCPTTSHPHSKLLQSLQEALISAFQVSCRAGPLCEEPLMGVAYQIVDMGLSDTKTADSQKIEFSLVQSNEELEEKKIELESKMFALAKSAFRNALEAHQKYLYEAFYRADIQVNSPSLGKVYAVLSKRRAEVIEEEINERSGSSTVRAYLPVAEGIGFAEELTHKSGGTAHAQLTFSHWKILDVDPFFEPTTEEEVEEWGCNAQSLPPNIALRYVNGVRKRKGLPVRDKLVEGANKQRTLSKKK